jgi:hypothetical protein
MPWPVRGYSARSSTIPTAGAAFDGSVVGELMGFTQEVQTGTKLYRPENFSTPATELTMSLA